jgi:hypothetical protein
MFKLIAILQLQFYSQALDIPAVTSSFFCVVVRQALAKIFYR